MEKFYLLCTFFLHKICIFKIAKYKKEKKKLKNVRVQRKIEKKDNF